MRALFLVLTLALSGAALHAPLASAQEKAPGRGSAQMPQKAEGDAKAGDSKSGGPSLESLSAEPDRVKRLDALFAALKVAPDHLEAWNKRATIFYMKQDYANSLADLRQVVAREPRLYTAWSGIAIIAKEVGDEKHALEAARKALAIYPRFEQAKDIEEELTISVEGRPI